MGSNNYGGSQILTNLAQVLLPYKPIYPPEDNKTKEPIFSPKSESVAESLTKPIASTAAVLICLFENEEGDLSVILTKRSSTLSSHSGEVSLPGGKAEEGDADHIETALREAKEEIGLDPSLVEVLAVLESFTTKRGMTVVPVIGILSDKESFNPVINAAEVEAIFDAPLEMFLKDENRRAEEGEWMGDKYLLHFFDYEAQETKYVIWALTAGILIKVASIVYQRPPEFQEWRPKFWSRNH